MTSDPATAIAAALDRIAREDGANAAVAMAEAMVCAGSAVIINERGERYAYQQIQQLADDIALKIIATCTNCGND